MKLAAHYNRASIIISVSILLISGFVYYLVINHIARQQLDSDLVEELEEVVAYVSLNHHLPKQIRKASLPYFLILRTIIPKKVSLKRGGQLRG